MRTLRELGTFIGLPEDAGDFGITQIRMKIAGEILGRVSNGAERTSLQAMIRRVSLLPPVSLEVELLGARPGTPPYVFGEEPLEPVFRIRPSNGLVLSTRIHFVESNREFTAGPNYGAAGGDFAPTQLGPGTWQLLVKRAAISNNGFLRLVATFRASVRAIPSPPPEPPPEPPRPPDPPAVTCSAELDLNQPGFEGITNMRIFGGGMQQGETVVILEHEQELARTVADALGLYQVRIGFLHGQLPTLHTVRARGQTSGRVSSDAAFNV